MVRPRPFKRQYEGTHQHGELFGVQPSGRLVRVSGVTLYRIVSGSVVEERGVADVLGLMQQLGAFRPRRYTVSRLVDRILVGAHAPGSFLWLLVAVILAGTLWSALLGDGSLVVEGLFSAAVVVGVISITSRTLGWRFWPR